MSILRSQGQVSSPPPPDADAIVVGAGPAGMSAAIELASSGRKIIVLDLQQIPGGQVFRSLETNLADPATAELRDALGATYLAGAELIRKFRTTSGIDYRPETIVWDLRPGGTVGWFKDGSAGYLRAPHIILANGAMERPVAFPGWTLPGVMTAGAVQTLLKAGRLKPDGRIVFAGTGPLIFLLVDQLRRLGVKPKLIARTDKFWDKLAAIKHLRFASMVPLIKGLWWLFLLRLARIPTMSGMSELRANGTDKIESVSLKIANRTVDIPCDLLVVHDGIIPSIDLAHGAGIQSMWQDEDLCWRVKSSVDGRTEKSIGPSLTDGACVVRVSGDARAIGGADAAIAHGRYVAKSIMLEGRPTYSSKNKDLDEARAAFHRSMAIRPFLDTAFPMGLAKRRPDDATVICRCEEITAGSIREEICKGVDDINLIRGILRCGMGPCQGRNCATTLAYILTEKATSKPVPFRARPPFRPLPLSALAHLENLDPELAKVDALNDKASELGSDVDNG